MIINYSKKEIEFILESTQFVGCYDLLLYSRRVSVMYVEAEAEVLECNNHLYHLYGARLFDSKNRNINGSNLNNYFVTKKSK